MSLFTRFRAFTMAGALALFAASIMTPVGSVAAATDPISGSWLATAYATSGNSVAILTFHDDHRVTVSPVSGSIPPATGDWSVGTDGYVVTTHAFRAGPGGKLELERTRSVLRLDSRNNSWSTKESYSQFLDPTEMKVIAAQSSGLMLRAVPVYSLPR